MADYRTDNPFDEPQVAYNAPPQLPPKKPSSAELVFPGEKPQPQQAPPHSNYIGPSSMSADALDRKEAELLRRKEDIDRREKMLLDKEQSMTKLRKKNWPKFRPILYHDIREDIPTPELQSLVRKAYIGWYLLVVTYLWNIITVLSVLIVGSGSGSAIGSFFLSLVYALFSIPVGFLIYRLLYNAARKTSSSLYVLYFLNIWLSICVFIVLALGFDGWGSGGFFIMISTFNDDEKTVGVFCVVCLILYALIAIYHIVIFFLARKEYRKAGGIAAAKNEASGLAVRGTRLQKGDD